MDLKPPSRIPVWQSRSLWCLVVTLLAVAYFGSYYQHGINFRDEGGTVTLLAKRLHDGEVPFRDVLLGYNVGWFYPIAGLFGLTGVSFVGLRIYFFALSTLAAILGFLTVERAARHAGMRWGAVILGMAAAIMLILVPGMTFKNYNPLAVVANTWCLLGFVLANDADETRRKAWRGGFVLGATWLVRIDLGTFFTVLWIGTVLARMFERALLYRGKIAGRALLNLFAAVAIIHTPVLIHAQMRGYLSPFLAAYTTQWVKLGHDFSRVAGFKKSSPPQQAPTAPAAATSNAPAPDAPATAAPTPKPPPSGGGNETLSRTDWGDVQAAKEDKKDEVFGLFMLTYLPALALACLALWAAVAWIRQVAKRGFPQTPLAALVLVGGALTLFPQFFFWRPDAPHLSEFGPGFWVAVCGAGALLGGWGKGWYQPARWLGVLIAVTAVVWLWRMLPDRWCGTIAARTARKTWFEGANGVRVFEQKKTVDWLVEVQRIVRERSGLGDYLVAYPYHPAFNIITDRRTYEKTVYVDNATTQPSWSKGAVERMERFKPKIVIVSGWKVNGTPASQFKNWAGPVLAHVRANYESAGVFGDRKKDGSISEEDSYEVFVRKAPVPAVISPAPAAPAPSPLPAVPAVPPAPSGNP